MATCFQVQLPTRCLACRRRLLCQAGESGLLTIAMQGKGGCYGRRTKDGRVRETTKDDSYTCQKPARAVFPVMIFKLSDSQNASGALRLAHRLGDNSNSASEFREILSLPYDELTKQILRSAPPPPPRFRNESSILRTGVRLH